VPDARKQRHDGTVFDTMAFGGYLGFKHALALGDVHQLVGGKDATMIPIEMVIDGVAPRWVRTSRLHPFITHRSSGAFPRILLRAGNTELPANGCTTDQKETYFFYFSIPCRSV
jgi:hypothetical protein